MGIKIDVKKNVIPIEFGELTFEFPLDLESNEKFFRMEDEIGEEINRIAKEREKTEFKENMTPEEFAQVRDLQKRSLTLQYDYILGKGSFEQIHDKYPDVVLLTGLLVELTDNIADELHAMEENNKRKSKQRMEKYTKRKKK